MPQEILMVVCDILRRELNDPTILVTLETVADDVPFWDSLAHVRIIVAIEGHFGIRFDPVELTSFANVGELVAAIGEKVRK